MGEKKDGSKGRKKKRYNEHEQGRNQFRQRSAQIEPIIYNWQWACPAVSNRGLACRGQAGRLSVDGPIKYWQNWLAHTPYGLFQRPRGFRMEREKDYSMAYQENLAQTLDINSLRLKSYTVGRATYGLDSGIPYNGTARGDEFTVYVIIPDQKNAFRKAR